MFQNALARVKYLEFIEICKTGKKASVFDILYNHSSKGFDNNKFGPVGETNTGIFCASSSFYNKHTNNDNPLAYKKRLKNV